MYSIQLNKLSKRSIEYLIIMEHIKFNYISFSIYNYISKLIEEDFDRKIGIFEQKTLKKRYFLYELKKLEQERQIIENRMRIIAKELSYID